MHCYMTTRVQDIPTPIPKSTLTGIAFASYLYGLSSGYDTSLMDFRRKVSGLPDLDRPDHVETLIEWLRKWGCRQFALEYTQQAIGSIRSWYENHRQAIQNLPPELNSYQEDHFQIVEELFRTLSECIASYRRNNKVTVGPTGAAKILFALKPYAFPPWDYPIRDRLDFKSSEKGYTAFLKHTKEILVQLEKECIKQGFELSKLPTMIGRNQSSVVKLIDEYYWMVITKKYHPPPRSIIEKWFNWS